LRPQCLIGECIRNRSAELCDGAPCCVSRREKSMPIRNVEARQSCLVHRRNIGNYGERIMAATAYAKRPFTGPKPCSAVCRATHTVSPPPV
jgi:hypothetical protein